jgi:hypothetical protein
MHNDRVEEYIAGEALGTYITITVTNRVTGEDIDVAKYDLIALIRLALLNSTLIQGLSNLERVRFYLVEGDNKKLIIARLYREVDTL